MFRTWLAYLIGHKGSIADSLSPRRKDIGALFRDQFVMMTEREVTLEQLLEVRERLIAEIRSRVGAQEKAFLLSVKRGDPQWGLLGLQRVEQLPAVKWKMHNLTRMSSDAHNVALTRLEKVLSEIE